MRLAALSLFLTASVSYGSVVFYSDPSQFLQAAQAIPNTGTQLEMFSGPGLTAPGLQFQDYSDFGVHFPVSVSTISNGLFHGCDGYACLDSQGLGYAMNVSTVWSFTRPIFAFGATFQYLNRDEYQTAGISGFPYVDGFSGFVSDQPLTSLLFTAAEDTTKDPLLCPAPCVPATTLYTMDNLYIQVDPQAGSETPEPATLGLGISFLFVLGLLRRKRNATCL